MNRINLQNTPDPADTIRTPVEFRSGEQLLKGMLFHPRDLPGPLPAVVVTGAWTTVKEQMPGTYARALAQRGLVALAFDFAGWGESEGAPRFVEDPTRKTADIHSAVEFLRCHELVDAERVTGLGICASSGYMAAVAANNPVMSKLALVAPWIHDPAMAEGIYGGPDAVAQLVSVSRTREEILTAASASDETSVMYQAPYYTESDRGLIAEYDNKFNVASWEPWLTYDGQASADTLHTPTLIVCSEAAALPAGAHAFVKRTNAQVTEVWLENVSQFDFYDRADVVNTAVEAIAKHVGGEA